MKINNTITNSYDYLDINSEEYQEIHLSLEDIYSDPKSLLRIQPSNYSETELRHLGQAALAELILGNHIIGLEDEDKLKGLITKLLKPLPYSRQFSYEDLEYIFNMINSAESIYEYLRSSTDIVSLLQNSNKSRFF